MLNRFGQKIILQPVETQWIELSGVANDVGNYLQKEATPSNINSFTRYVANALRKISLSTELDDSLRDEIRHALESLQLQLSTHFPQEEVKAESGPGLGSVDDDAMARSAAFGSAMEEYLSGKPIDDIDDLANRVLTPEQQQMYKAANIQPTSIQPTVLGYIPGLVLPSAGAGVDDSEEQSSVFLLTPAPRQYSHVFRDADKGVNLYFQRHETTAFDKNNHGLSCGPVALETSRAEMYGALVALMTDSAPSAANQAKKDRIFDLVAAQIRIGLTSEEKMVGQAVDNAIRGDGLFLGENAEQVKHDINEYDTAIGTISTLVINCKRDLNAQLPDENKFDNENGRSLIKKLSDLMSQTRKFSPALLQQIQSKHDELMTLLNNQVELNNRINAALKNKTTVLDYFQWIFTNEMSGCFILLEANDLLSGLIALGKNGVIYKELSAEPAMKPLCKVDEYIPQPDQPIHHIVMIVNGGHYEKMTLEFTEPLVKKNVASSTALLQKSLLPPPVTLSPGYLQAVEMWNTMALPEGVKGDLSAAATVQFEKLVATLTNDGSFESHFFLAQLFQQGVQRQLSYLRQNIGATLQVPSNLEKSIHYYQQAAQLYREKTKREIKVAVAGEEKALVSKNHSEMALEDINHLVKQVYAGNPDAMYQLARFYQAELSNIKDATKRKIHISALDQEKWLNTSIKACLTAAAKLFHPQAAQALLEDKTVSMKDKVQFAMTAADPAFAQSHYSAPTREGTTTIEFRNHHKPMTDPVTLKKCDGIHKSLCEFRNAISNASLTMVGAVRKSAVTSYSRQCLIPLQHTAYEAPAATATPSAPKDKAAELRAARLARFAPGKK